VFGTAQESSAVPNGTGTDRGDLQSVVAGYARSALELTTSASVIGRAVDTVAAGLGVPIVTLFRWTAPDRMRYEHVHGPIDLETGRDYALVPEPAPEWTTAVPIQVQDGDGHRFPQPDAVHQAGVRAALSAGIVISHRTWGRLSVFDTRPRSWSEAEVDFLCSLTAVLGAAMHHVSGLAMHAAAAEFGQFALGSHDLDATIARAALVARTTLDGSVGMLARCREPRRLLVLCADGVGGIPPGDEVEVPSDLDPTAGQDLVRVEDLGARTGQGTAGLWAADGMVSALAVTLHLGSRPWGQLSVFDTRPRSWREVEVDFLRSLTHVLASAVDRAVGEVAQAAVAAFGRFAVQEMDLDAVLDRAQELAMQVLEVSACTIARWIRPGRARLVRARGPIRVSVGQEFDLAPELARVWSLTEPMPVPDWDGESEVPIPRALRESSLKSSLYVSIMVEGVPWGRMVVHDLLPRRWRQVEIDFIQSLANILATAVESAESRTAQAAGAEFGQYALESKDLEATLARAVEVATQVLQTPMGTLCRFGGAGRWRVVNARGRVASSVGEETPAVLQDDRDGDLVRVQDWRTEVRLVQPERERDAGVLSSLGVTLRVGDRCWAQLTVQDVQPRHWRRVEVDFLRSLANTLVAAVDRSIGEAAQAAMAELGQLALESPDLHPVLDRAVELAQEILDVAGCVLAIRVRNRIQVRIARGLPDLSPGLEFEYARETGWERAWCVTEPISVEDWQTETSAFRPRAVGENEVRSSLSAAVLVGGQPWGRIVANDLRPRRWRESEVSFVQSLANVLTLAVEHDRMQSRLRTRTRQLQEVLMPSALPSAVGVELAARYVPSGDLEVGGDWYDVLELPYGGLALVMGDVEGHDGPAAAIMGQVRTVLSTYVAEGYPPAEVLSRTSGFVAAHTDRLVSCCYVELHPKQRTVTCVSAGHPVPVVLDRHHDARELSLEPGSLLGAQPDPSYVEHTAVLAEGSCLALVTDGLLDVLPGVMYPDLASFSRAAQGAVGGSVENLADHLVRTGSPAQPLLRDDAALLLARLSGATRSRSRLAVRVFGPFPSSCTAARSFTRDLLTSWQLDALGPDAALAVSELVTNALVHTTSPVRLTLRQRDQDQLWIGVHDISDHPLQPVPDSVPVDTEAVSGRGLQIVDQVATAWGVVPSPRRSGKTVWLELTLAH
jgi:GAF domain-containing protein/anti-sigma regulatory factor (Ser/Thr protein kinase)